MKVVVGVDGSDLSNQAVSFMNRLLSPKVDDLLLYFSPPEIHLASKTPISIGVLEDASRALSESVFGAANLCLSSEMRSVTSEMNGKGLPASGLIELAEREAVDLVVVGSKSATRKFPFLLGSTARTVIHHTGKPVMVVRGPVADGPLNVVIACDQDRWCDATGVLRDISWPDETSATLFHVIPAFDEEFVDSLQTQGCSRVPNSTQIVEEYRAAINKRRDKYAARLESLQKTGPTLIRNAKVDVAQGDPVDEIIEIVQREKADLLVVSSRKLSTIGRMLGSVTESLLTRCPCSLLIVHDQAISEPKRRIEKETQTA